MCPPKCPFPQCRLRTRQFRAQNTPRLGRKAGFESSRPLASRPCAQHRGVSLGPVPRARLKPELAMPAPARAAHAAAGGRRPPASSLSAGAAAPSPQPSDGGHGPSGPAHGSRSAGLSAAGKETKGPRDESTPPRQQAAATKPNLPDSDPAEVRRRWQRRCPPQRSLTRSRPLTW